MCCSMKCCTCGFPVEHRGASRCVHTLEFKDAERQFPRLKEAKEMLKAIC